MDTILNLGLNDKAVEGLKAWTANGRFAVDSYRRFIQMFGNVVLEIPKEVFDREFDRMKVEKGVLLDTELDEAALRKGGQAISEGRSLGDWSAVSPGPASPVENGS